jgi:hypothetical protein
MVLVPRFWKFTQSSDKEHDEHNTTSADDVCTCGVLCRTFGFKPEHESPSSDPAQHELSYNLETARRHCKDLSQIHRGGAVLAWFSYSCASDSAAYHRRKLSRRSQPDNERGQVDLRSMYGLCLVN